MKNKKWLAALFIALFAVSAVALPHLRTSVAAQPGEANDPLVTRRYVDMRIDDVWNEIQTLRAENQLLRNMIEAGGLPGVPSPGGYIDLQAVTAAVFTQVMFNFEALYGEMLRNAAAVGEGIIADDTERLLEFTIINTQAGQRLIIENGTEVILRTGGATVIAGPDGLVNMTLGRDIGAGEEVGRNQLLIAPRTDGRGLLFTAPSSWVMVRGAFTLE